MSNQQPPNQGTPEFWGNMQPPPNWQGTTSQQTFNPQYPPGQYPPVPQQGQFPQGYPQPPMMQPSVQAPKKKSRKGLIIGAVVLVVALALCGVIGSALSHNASATTSTTASSGGTSNAPATTGTWTTVQTFSGSGAKKTASFTVPDTWKMTWTCKGIDIAGSAPVDGALAIIVYGSDNSPVDTASTTCKAGQVTHDETSEHQGGTVYLQITGTSDWTLQVQVQK